MFYYLVGPRFTPLIPPIRMGKRKALASVYPWAQNSLHGSTASKCYEERG